MLLYDINGWYYDTLRSGVRWAMKTTFLVCSVGFINPVVKAVRQTTRYVLGAGGGLNRTEPRCSTDRLEGRRPTYMTYSRVRQWTPVSARNTHVIFVDQRLRVFILKRAALLSEKVDDEVMERLVKSYITKQGYRVNQCVITFLTPSEMHSGVLRTTPHQKCAKPHPRSQ